MGESFYKKGGRTKAEGLRRGTTALAAFLLVTAPLTPGFAASGALGVVVADEPHAAIAARDVLEKGGSVADAATALYFTLSVTYPVAAGLGGGGVCLHYDPKTKTATSIDFLPRASRTGGAIAVPGSVRGFAYLQSRFGHMAWRDLILPAQRLAALGFPIPRALVDAVSANEKTVKASPFLSDLFTDENNALVEDGDQTTQVSLAATLAVIAGKGPAGFYGGAFADQLAQDATAQGGQFTREDLYDYRAQETPAQSVTLKAGTVIAPATQTGAGALAAEILPNAGTVAGSHDSSAIIGAASSAVSDALHHFNVAGLPADFGSTGFVVADHEGEIVSCGVTMAKPFGTAREVGQTGFALAPAPEKGDAGLAGAFLMPLIAIGPKGRNVLFTGVGSGGPDAVSGVTAAALASFARDANLVEPIWSAASKSRASSVNLVICSKGLETMSSCKAAPDAQGHGVALQGQQQRAGGGGFLGLF